MEKAFAFLFGLGSICSVLTLRLAVGRAYKLLGAAHTHARGLDFNYPDRNLGIKGTARAPRMRALRAGEFTRTSFQCKGRRSSSTQLK